ncbi:MULTISPECIES: LysR family transcriptional regulator [Aquitalea]|uniref:DNA-binding transcriptional LysR family regulator n=1 Tax=Aquitalea magnusonii TaxID=332411 RepID=A0A318JGV4_9NEIS|nr:MULTISPECIES: LysR family transcriptional regulator [Aquitalea]PXX49610.1 DNA-binding transcriptional LysR family regulator [Aquitalea magnusonii]
MLHGIALKYFVEVARCGSLAAASENLQVAVSAISRQISKLEQETGTPLFERLPRGMVLTEAGQLLAEHARRTLLDAQSVLGEISSRHATSNGLVRLACTDGFAHVFLPDVMMTYHRLYPQIRFVLQSGIPEQVRHWVETGAADIGLGFAMENTHGIELILQSCAPVCALLRPGHPLAGQALLTLADLTRFPLAILERGNTVRQLLEWSFAAQGKVFEPLLSSDHTSTLHRFATHTDTIALGSRLAIHGLPDGASLLAKNIDEPLLQQRQLQLMTMKARRLPAAVSTFLRLLECQLQQALQA